METTSEAFETSCIYDNKFMENFDEELENRHSISQRNADAFIAVMNQILAMIDDAAVQNKNGVEHSMRHTMKLMEKIVETKLSHFKHYRKMHVLNENMKNIKLNIASLKAKKRELEAELEACNAEFENRSVDLNTKFQAFKKALKYCTSFLNVRVEYEQEKDDKFNFIKVVFLSGSEDKPHNPIRFYFDRSDFTLSDIDAGDQLPKDLKTALLNKAKETGDFAASFYTLRKHMLSKRS